MTNMLQATKAVSAAIRPPAQSGRSVSLQLLSRPDVDPAMQDHSTAKGGKYRHQPAGCATDEIGKGKAGRTGSICNHCQIPHPRNVGGSFVDGRYR
jgi:hypothetical protein